MKFIKNNKSKDYTETVKLLYELLTGSYKNILRISSIWNLLEVVLGIQKFEILDPRFYQNGNFESWLIDKQIDWCSGKDVDFGEIYDAILTIGDFTSAEKLLMESGDIGERLWAIFLAITDKTLNFKNND